MDLFRISDFEFGICTFVLRHVRPSAVSFLYPEVYEISGARIVGPLTALWRALSAVVTIFRLRPWSASMGRFGSPQGWGILVPATIRLDFICFASVAIGVIWATGTPPLSISLTIVAPLRVQVPQVDTSRAPSIPSAFMSRRISLPIFCMAETDAKFPGVT